MVFVGQIEEGKVISATDAITRLRERKAAKVLDQIAEKFVGLSEMPERGVYPKELIALGIRDYREIFFNPYRIIYRIVGGNVYISNS